MGSIKDFLIKSHKGLYVLLTSGVLAISACGGKDKLEALEGCEIPANHKLEEICNNVDDNCNGEVDEGCNDDRDGFCGKDKKLVYDKGGPYLDVCPGTFRDCDEFACDVGYFGDDCDDDTSDDPDLNGSNPGTGCPTDRVNCGGTTSTCAICINPDAVEVCNGIDDDCNDEVDEFDPLLYEPCGTLDAEKDGIGECTVGLYECLDGVLTCTGEQLPKPETCNDLDEDCSGFIDDNEAILDVNICFYEGEGFGEDWHKVSPCEDITNCPTMYTGTCSPGIEKCTRVCNPSLPNYEFCETGKPGGDNICYGVILPKPEECNGYDEDCDGLTDEDFDLDSDTYAWCMGDCDDSNPAINPGADEILCNDVDENCDGIKEPGTDEDQDSYYIEGGPCGPVDCNDHQPLSNPGLEEVCDCIDNNCEGLCLGDLSTTCTIDLDCEEVGGPCILIDEGLHTLIPLDFIFGGDCSGSMIDDNEALESNLTASTLLDCFEEEIINVTTVIIDRPPYVARDLVTFEEFRANISSDLPNGNCDGLEPTLNTIVYAACLVPAAENDRICLALDAAERNSFKNYDNPELSPQVWRTGSKKYIIIFTDEAAQCRYRLPILGSLPIFNQKQAAELAAKAGITVDVYTLANPETNQDFHNMHLYDPATGAHEYDQGFGYFATLTGGTLYDLKALSSDSTLGDKFSQSFVDRFCMD